MIFDESILNKAIELTSDPYLRKLCEHEDLEVAESWQGCCVRIVENPPKPVVKPVRPRLTSEQVEVMRLANQGRKPCGGCGAKKKTPSS